MSIATRIIINAYLNINTTMNIITNTYEHSNNIKLPLNIKYFRTDRLIYKFLKIKRRVLK